MRYKHTYNLLKQAGHSPYKALEIVLDAIRGNRYALMWIRIVRNSKRNRVLKAMFAEVAQEMGARR